MSKPKIGNIAYPKKGTKEGKITIENLSYEEVERMEAMLSGFYHVRGGDKGLQFTPHYMNLPSPARDEDMIPFWRCNTPNREEAQMKFWNDEGANHNGAGIIISSLCGYGFTKERYQRNAQILESIGFSCMRSQRGEDGKFWEHWYLPGTWSAKGDLKDHIQYEASIRGNKSLAMNRPQVDSKTDMDSAIAWLCRNVSFGSLSMTTQRAAMVMD